MDNPNTHYKETPSGYINLSFGVLSIYVAAERRLVGLYAAGSASARAASLPSLS